MINIAVELGSYSIKFISFQTNKKSIQILKTDEVVIEETYNDESEKLSTQVHIIEDYISQIDFEFQLYLSFEFL